MSRKTNKHIWSAHIHSISIEIEKLVRYCEMTLYIDVFGCLSIGLSWEQNGNGINIKYTLCATMRTVSKIELYIVIAASLQSAAVCDSNGNVKRCLYLSFDRFKCRSAIECVKSAETQPNGGAVRAYCIRANILYFCWINDWCYVWCGVVWCTRIVYRLYSLFFSNSYVHWHQPSPITPARIQNQIHAISAWIWYVKRTKCILCTHTFRMRIFILSLCITKRKFDFLLASLLGKEEQTL